MPTYILFNFSIIIIHILHPNLKIVITQLSNLFFASTVKSHCLGIKFIKADMIEFSNGHEVYTSNNGD